MTRTEPSAALIPTAGQQRLAYVCAAESDIRVRFDAMRKAAAPKQAPHLIVKREKKA